MLENWVEVVGAVGALGIDISAASYSAKLCNDLLVSLLIYLSTFELFIIHWGDLWFYYKLKLFNDKTRDFSFLLKTKEFGHLLYVDFYERLLLLIT